MEAPHRSCLLVGVMPFLLSEESSPSYGKMRMRYVPLPQPQLGRDPYGLWNDTQGSKGPQERFTFRPDYVANTAWNITILQRLLRPSAPCLGAEPILWAFFLHGLPAEI